MLLNTSHLRESNIQMPTESQTEFCEQTLRTCRWFTVQQSKQLKPELDQTPCSFVLVENRKHIYWLKVETEAGTYCHYLLSAAGRGWSRSLAMNTPGRRNGSRERRQNRQ